MEENVSNAPVLNPRKGPKSRNGCLKCKAKRLKCDEGKPHCLKCKAGTCPGYKSKPLIWSTKHEKLLHLDSGSFNDVSTGQPLPETSKLPESERNPSPDQHGLEPNTIDPGVSTRPISPVSLVKNPPSSPTKARRESISIDSLSAIRQQLHRSTVPDFLLHLPTMLVEYYFSYVCQIFSSFDGSLNPFRSTIGKLWDGSAPIYYAIQSMAAAYLSNHFPRMSPVGLQMQREAYKSLYQFQQGGLPSSENLDKTLLTVLLVGQTTAWHNPSDLGLVHLKTAKRLNHKRIEQQGTYSDQETETRARRQNSFFGQCILYWDMLVGFVEDDIDGIAFDNSANDIHQGEVGLDADAKSSEQVFPHPWTGVAPKAQILLSKVGRLVRKYRKAVAQDVAAMSILTLNLGFDVEYGEDITTTSEALFQAQILEEELLSFEPPSVARLVDAGDENTPPQQYITLAEAYRCAALLELYRVFPAVLAKRIPSPGGEFEDNPSSSTNEATFSFFPMSSNTEDFMPSLALHLVSLLEELPANSGTRCVQPLIFIIAASELLFSSNTNTDPLSPFVPASSIFNSITNREIDIATARRFIISRLQEFQLSLPAKPLLKAVQLIQETWARADLGQDVFWMDVMAELGCASIFG